jgi:hypothetical protein
MPINLIFTVINLIKFSFNQESYSLLGSQFTQKVSRDYDSVAQVYKAIDNISLLRKLLHFADKGRIEIIQQA